MKKTTLIVTIAGLAVVVGFWAFFTYGSHAQQPLSDAQKQVLAVQDARLSKGSEKAPVKIVEYADILCPYCAKANEQIIPHIQSDYIDRDEAHYEVRLVAMISPDSERAAEGAYCAAEQNKFWNYIDMAYQETWNNYYSQNKPPEDVPLFRKEAIASFARRVGVDTSQWQHCMDEGTYKATIAQNQQQMTAIKAYGTPHFIINGKNYNGAPPYEAFKAVIDGELQQAKAGS